MADETSAKVVYCVRHGQSEDNVAPVFQSPDSPLSAVGRKQAERIAERASKLAFEVLLASPYRRAQETAAVIGNVTGKALELCELFTERVKPTSVNGKPYIDAQAAKVCAHGHRVSIRPACALRMEKIMMTYSPEPAKHLRSLRTVQNSPLLS